jgi:hemerythrin-like metal-binding protein
MSKLEWQDSWSVVNPSLDEDHKRLISIIYRVGGNRTLSKDLARVISELENYAEYHFARGEKLMEEANIPDLEEHKKAHRAFVDWLENIRQTFTSQQARRLLTNTVDDYLRDWLKNHILKTDMKYKGLI